MSLADEALIVADARSFFAEGRSFAWNLISTRLTQFSYFDQLLRCPVWKGRKVLDFGGNIGTFLVGAVNNVDHDDYWCLDLNPAVVEQGRRTYPRAHFVHYNRYSSQYNSNGVRHLPIPECGVKFDIILAFSVFTHTDRSEMLELVGQLRTRLAPGGALAFTFTVPHYESWPESDNGSNLKWRLEKTHETNPAVNVEGLLEQGRGADWCVLIDDKLYVEPGDELCHQTRVGRPLENYCSFFTVDYMASLFPEATVHPPVNSEWQHCCILKKTG